MGGSGRSLCPKRAGPAPGARERDSPLAAAAPGLGPRSLRASPACSSRRCARAPGPPARPRPRPWPWPWPWRCWRNQLLQVSEGPATSIQTGRARGAPQVKQRHGRARAGSRGGCLPLQTGVSGSSPGAAAPSGVTGALVARAELQDGTAQGVALRGTVLYAQWVCAGTAWGLSRLSVTA